MASYLAKVKTDVKEVFDAAFEELWSEILEPALKESYSNGLAKGKENGKPGDGKDSKSPEPRRRFRRQRPAGSSP